MSLHKGAVAGSGAQCAVACSVWYCERSPQRTVPRDSDAIVESGEETLRKMGWSDAQFRSRLTD